MQRRRFLSLGACALPVSFLSTSLVTGGAHAAPARAAAPSAAEGWRTFELTTQVDLPATNAPANVWLPVATTPSGGYQQALGARWEAPGANAEVRTVRGAAGIDVPMLAVAWPGGGEPTARRVTLVNTFATRDRRVDLSRPPSANAPRESPQVLRRYLQPTELQPTDGLVRETAEKITRARQGDVEKARAIYQWIVENCRREGAVRGCGTGDVRYMLTTGNLAGKCADINALFTALARSVGIPARDAYGVRVASSRHGFNSLGKAGDVTRAQHCRAEFYAAGYGWVPVDPADVRKVVLEEVPGGLPLDDLKVRAARAMLFGQWEMNWVAFNHGADIALPGARTAGDGTVPFLMYPNGEVAHARLDSLDPDTFRYRMTARELTA
ncbi:transglutaminase domain-containing protein [Pandoraea nosoerga]|uniref:Transglutaminase n=1 Tax=Pandoraea nosoerga TaxID=2508296 RepID=A0A5E4U5K1_9BURK|nr:transglutaminase domain-containing protein [Pandoraea nosoerga]MBN4667832.1 transglutaminase domain-containing protein [Pandoraea nosoerga]MBN4677688.1 transglutaminase domain-containing protein [Pandoraea nosoerga]MBN4682701.1 transglutaminase domain-containing protein [Pandoraea nosoerga]MBN4746900.1 transglutaminase domain-containing protein [Pandoraea nosoerga]VVD94873.1 transglutaminase [Pandoraea nosoerga]